MLVVHERAGSSLGLLGVRCSADLELLQPHSAFCSLAGFKGVARHPQAGLGCCSVLEDQGFWEGCRVGMNE